MSINVLLVEDDLDLASTIIDFLELESISCDHAANGVHGLALLHANQYDVLILDINLPQLDGLSVCHKLREDCNDIPVLMLTARDTLNDKIAGFDVGTDDYLVKPFEIEELMVRVHALSRRRSGQVFSLQLGDLVFKLKERVAFYGEAPVKLTPITAKILEKLMRSQGFVAREVLMSFIWGDEQPDSNSLKVHIHHLRKQLDKAEAELSIINEPGLGFALKHGVDET